ncbi:type IV pilin, partial [Salmonella enterica subsp. enterica serovar Gallinarum]|nr:type IV pilin [Salmonella enterica subsp. enterica serovar Gallinarum]
RAQAESNNIATIQAGVKALYTSASSFTGLTNTVAVQAKIFPDNMLSGTGNAAKPINAFKGNVTLAAAGNFYTAKVGSKVVKAADGTLDVAATAAACNNATSNTLVFTSI